MVSEPPPERTQGIPKCSDGSNNNNDGGGGAYFFPCNSPSDAAQMQDPRVHPACFSPSLTIRAPSPSSLPSITHETPNPRSNGAAFRAAYRTPSHALQASGPEQIAVGQYALIPPRAAQPARARACAIRDGHAQAYAFSRMGLCGCSSGR